MVGTVAWRGATGGRVNPDSFTFRGVLEKVSEGAAMADDGRCWGSSCVRGAFDADDGRCGGSIGRWEKDLDRDGPLVTRKKYIQQNAVTLEPHPWNPH